MQTHKEIQLGSLQLRINWLVAGCVLITVLGLGRLGLWQLDRAAEKVAAQRALQAELQDNAPTLESLIQEIGTEGVNDQWHNRHVALNGEFLNARTVLVLAEFHEGQIGYGVVTPFRLHGNGQLVLVNRGWTTGILRPETAPNLDPVSGPVEITGQVHVPPDNRRVLTSNIDAREWPLRVRSLEFDVLSEIMGEPLFPFEIRLTENQPGTLVRHWPAVNIDVNQNLFYALQWFSFAVIILIAALFGSSNLWQLLRSDR